MCKESVKLFVCEEHIPAIEQFCKDYHCCISFRRAGKETVDRMKLGHPCKGHDVLEKSIKPSRPDKFESGSALTLADYALLGGLIGHRGTKPENKGLLKGVYVSDKALGECGSKAKTDPDAGFWEEVKRVKKKNDDWEAEAKAAGKSTFKIRRWIDLTDGVKQFLSNKAKAAPYFLTGDYDVHDFFKREAGKLYPCGHTEHMEMQRRLNEQLIAKVTAPSGLDRRTIVQRGELENEFSFIRHGGQIEYCLYMALKESGVQRVYNVVVADYDVAFCDDQGKWIVCDASGIDKAAAKTAYEHWYEAHHVEIKESFDPKNISAIWKQMERGLPAKTLLALAIAFLYKDDETGTGKDSTGLFYFNHFRSYFRLAGSMNTVAALKKTMFEAEAKEFLDTLTEEEQTDISFKNLKEAAGKYVYTYLGRHPDEISGLAYL